MKKIFGWLILLLALIGIFFIGRYFGGNTVNQQVLSNSLIVREIAELSSLEVQGNANIKRSNVLGDGSWSDNIKKAFIENTIWVSVPYTAKYGVDVDEKNFKVEVAEKKVTVTLPAPKLLSYELRIDHMETSARKGLFMSSDDDTYTDVQKKLYQTSRQQMEANGLYMQQSKDKIRKIIAQYYAPFNYEVQVKFGDEPAQVVIPLKKD